MGIWGLSIKVKGFRAKILRRKGEFWWLRSVVVKGFSFGSWRKLTKERLPDQAPPVDLYVAIVKR